MFTGFVDSCCTAVSTCETVVKGYHFASVTVPQVVAQVEEVGQSEELSTKEKVCRIGETLTVSALSFCSTFNYASVGQAQILGLGARMTFRYIQKGDFDEDDVIEFGPDVLNFMSLTSCMEGYYLHASYLKCASWALDFFKPSLMRLKTMGFERKTRFAIWLNQRPGWKEKYFCPVAYRLNIGIPRNNPYRIHPSSPLLGEQNGKFRLFRIEKLTIEYLLKKKQSEIEVEGQKIDLKNFVAVSDECVAVPQMENLELKKVIKRTMEAVEATPNPSFTSVAWKLLTSVEKPPQEIEELRVPMTELYRRFTIDESAHEKNFDLRLLRDHQPFVDWLWEGRSISEQTRDLRRKIYFCPWSGHLLIEPRGDSTTIVDATGLQSLPFGIYSLNGCLIDDLKHDTHSNKPAEFVRILSNQLKDLWEQYIEEEPVAQESVPYELRRQFLGVPEKFMDPGFADWIWKLFPEKRTRFFCPITHRLILHPVKSHQTDRRFDLHLLKKVLSEGYREFNCHESEEEKWISLIDIPLKNLLEEQQQLLQEYHLLWKRWSNKGNSDCRPKFFFVDEFDKKHENYDYAHDALGLWIKSKASPEEIKRHFCFITGNLLRPDKFVIEPFSSRKYESYLYGIGKLILWAISLLSIYSNDQKSSIGKYTKELDPLPFETSDTSEMIWSMENEAVKAYFEMQRKAFLSEMRTHLR